MALYKCTQSSENISKAEIKVKVGGMGSQIHFLDHRLLIWEVLSVSLLNVKNTLMYLSLIHI